jgi:branched-chain amino acid aminotransferase
MRVVRMEIPMNFTMEYFENNYFLWPLIMIIQTHLVQVTVFRNDGGITCRILTRTFHFEFML